MKAAVGEAACSEAIGIAEEHLDIHINQKVINWKLGLYPQMYPFQQQLRLDSSGRNQEAPLSNEQSLTHSRNL